MKSIIVFYEDKSGKYGADSAFDGKSAETLAMNWAKKFSDTQISLGSETIADLFAEMKSACDENKADYVIYTYKDLPFLNEELTNKLIDFHTKYKSEYTFADGYPYGFAPEIIDAGTVSILSELSKSKYAAQGQRKVTRDGIFEFIKTDINAFEVESVISSEDWRLYRFCFHCGKKENFIACKELYKQIKDKKLDADQMSAVAAKTPAILKTVPGFYNVQICDSVNSSCSFCPYEKCYKAKYGIEAADAKNYMSLKDFSALVDKISIFSEKAVISLSAWGEPLNHPEVLSFVEKVLAYDGLSVLIETDGGKVTSEFCEKLKKLCDNAAPRTNDWDKVMVIVLMDAFTQGTYEKLHGNKMDLGKSVEAVKLLSEAVPDCVYPQFVRMNDNEAELENFFRYWNEKTNPSKGKLIIQKYDDYAKLLPECKPADLSPIERNVCWHLRRDMTILTDGSVPFCKEHILNGIIGNVFQEDLEAIWNKTNDVLLEHMNEQYNGKCKDCDEYYTFFF